MPAPLPAPSRKVTIRIDDADAELLGLVHPRQVNAVMRALVRGYCAKLRTRLEGQKEGAIAPIRADH